MLNTGIRGEAEAVVNETNIAKTHASGALPVFATPAMIGLMECAANDSVQPYLDAGQGTVGISLNVKHLAATPMGKRVRAQSELIAIDRKKLTFSVSAWDEAGLIGEGTHERFIIDAEKFMEKALLR